MRTNRRADLGEELRELRRRLRLLEGLRPRRAAEVTVAVVDGAPDGPTASVTVAPGTEVRIAVHVRAEPDGSVRVAATLVAPPVQ